MRLGREFFTREVLQVAPELLGKKLMRRLDGSAVKGAIITEVEAYGGEEDKASHARFGRTKRNAVMYGPGGLVYMYLVYGIHWMLNIVTGTVDQPQAILVRGLANMSGPGKVTRYLQLGKNFYGEDLSTSGRLWLEEFYPRGVENWRVQTAPRVGVSYAGEWAKKPWRFRLVRQPEGGGNRF
jgi:DNA-3-methyladenine glycosylase